MYDSMLTLQELEEFYDLKNMQLSPEIVKTIVEEV